MKQKIKAVILDWAGTTVDFGSHAPVAAFIKAFEKFGIEPTMEETRAPMGMQKRAHIASMLKEPRLHALWEEKYAHPPTQADIDELYAAFEPALMSSLEDYTTPLPGVLSTLEELRKMGLKIGSTTGYTAAMMEIVAPAAKKKGYAPDVLVCPDDVAHVGRPYPYMIWRNLEKLEIMSIDQVIKVGDTAADMQEGRNAGCLSVGIIKGSNMLGLSEDEFEALSPTEREFLYATIRQKYEAAGADYVLEDITALPRLLHRLNKEVN